MQIDRHLVYLMGGACLSERDVTMNSDRNVFLECGLHTSDTKCHGSSNVEIINIDEASQFDLGFCSVECLGKFFDSIVSQLAEKTG